MHNGNGKNGTNGIGGDRFGPSRRQQNHRDRGDEGVFEAQFSKELGIALLSLCADVDQPFKTLRCAPETRQFLGHILESEIKTFLQSEEYRKLVADLAWKALIKNALEHPVKTTYRIHPDGSWTLEWPDGINFSLSAEAGKALFDFVITPKLPKD